MADYDKLHDQAFAAFRFIVEMDGENLAAFTECTLPAIEWETEDIKEGGVNTYIHQLPGRRKAARISLKNGVGKSKLLEWYIHSMSEKFTRKRVTVILLNSLQVPVLTWDIENALPIKWAGPTLKSDASAIAIQTLDMICGEITVKVM